MTRSDARPGGSPATFEGEGREARLALPVLASVPGLVHAFTVSGSDPAAVLRSAAGVPLPLATLRQVHGALVRVVDGSHGTDEARGEPGVPPEGDALVTARSGVALGVFVADCAPVLVCDPRARALAAVHAGWRGTAAGVLKAAIAALCERYQARPERLRVAIGPAIGACCFEVGDEVVDALLRSDPGAGSCVMDGRTKRVDLVAANRRQAMAAGVPPSNIQSAGLCTRCRGDLLESYRRSPGRAGRMAGLIAWKSPAPADSSPTSGRRSSP